MEIPGERGEVLLSLKILKKCMEHNWKFWGCAGQGLNIFFSFMFEVWIFSGKYTMLVLISVVCIIFLEKYLVF